MTSPDPGPAYVEACGRPGCSPGRCAGLCTPDRRYDGDKLLAMHQHLARQHLAESAGVLTIREPTPPPPVELYFVTNWVGCDEIVVLAHLAEPDPDRPCGWRPICDEPDGDLEVTGLREGDGPLTWCGPCRAYATAAGITLPDRA